MKIFTPIHKILSPIHALNVLDECIKSTMQTEIFSLPDSWQRVVAKTVVATRPSPLFDNAAMDGYLFSLTDVQKLKIVAGIYAGDKPIKSNLAHDECYKIMTGAPIAFGANCVIPHEDTTKEDNFIKLNKICNVGDNIRKQGEEFNINDILIYKGQILDAGAISLLASQGIDSIECFSPLKIAVFSSGNELKEYNHNAQDYQIYNSNAPMIISALQAYHFHADYKGILRDDKNDIKQSFFQDYDVIISTGGVSGGELDLMRQSLIEMKYEIILHGVDIKPGKPLMVAQKGSKVFFGLPGNPMGAFVAFMLFVIPMLFKMSGAQTYYHDLIYSKLGTVINLKAGKYKVLLGSLKEGIFYPLKEKSSSSLLPIRDAHALLVVDPLNTSLKQEQIIKVIPLYTSLKNLSSHFANL